MVLFAQVNDYSSVVSQTGADTVVSAVPDTAEAKADTTNNTVIQNDTAVNETAAKKPEIKMDADDEDTIDASVIAHRLLKVRTAFTNKLSKSRAQGYGGGIMISPILGVFSMKPVNELVHNDKILKQYTFLDINDHYQPVLMMGGAAYGGVGRGIRIGITGWSGDYSFSSTSVNDSVLILSMRQSFGGFLLEKSFVHKNINYLIGGTFGFGSLDVTKSFSDDAWVKVSDEDENDAEKASATYSGINLHSGFTASVLPWMHVGLDVNSTFIFSANGFSVAGCNGFAAAIPGVRLRITLGNIG